MKPEEAAFINLVALARADGLVSPSEISLLEGYREALGVSVEFAEGVLKKEDLRALGSKEIKGKPSDRIQILKMMIRVAYADGLITSQEKKLLSRVAKSFGIGPIASRGLYWEIEREKGIRRKLRRSQIVAAVTIVVAALAVWVTFKHFSSKTEQRLSETRINLDELKTELGFGRAQAEDALKKVQKSQEDLAQNETALSKRLVELEKKDRQDLLKVEIDRLKLELARVRNLNAAFKEIEKEYGGSILLIFIAYELVLDKTRVPRGSMGSGFFATSVGHIVTNKHVVQPWKFSGDDIMLMESGYKIDPDSMIVAAWPAGAEVKTAGGDLNLDAAYNTVKKNLEVAKTTADTFEVQFRRLESGMMYRGRFHTIDQGDLAILKASPAFPVRAFPLALATDEIEKLDPVMVLGFPTGINILETTKAETSPSLGEVRKIEKSIMVTAPIVPGNSGGPLIDIQGAVVGVASRIYGEATLGSCIPSKYILPLLPAASDLLKDVARHEAAKAYRAALDDLRLAEQQCTDDKERKMIVDSRTRLFKIRDRMFAEAEKTKDKAAGKSALQKIVDQFGPVWGKEALELLRGL